MTSTTHDTHDPTALKEEHPEVSCYAPSVHSASLQDLPVELLDHLLTHFTHPAELLALSLTSCFFHLLTLEHLEWHSISLPTLNSPVLRELLACPRKAALVQRLVVTDTWTTTGRGYRLCSTCARGFPTGDDEPPEVDYPLWEELAQRLTGLRSLVLHVREVGKWKGFLRVVRGASTAGVKSLAMQQYLGFMYRFRVDTGGAVSALDEVRDLEEFDWYSALGQGRELLPALTLTHSRLCPTLRCLKLNPTSADAPTDGLFQLRFPLLQSCKLLNIHASPLLTPFLLAHPQLEVFHLHTTTGNQAFHLPAQALPRARDVDLRYFGSPLPYITLVSPLPPPFLPGTRRPLEHISLCAQALTRALPPSLCSSSCSTSTQSALERFCSELSQCAGVRKVTWIDLSHGLSESRLLEPVVRACRGVEEWVFAWNLPSGAAMTAVCDALSHLPHLATIRCPSSSLVPFEMLSQAERLGKGCRGLRRVGECVRVGRRGGCVVSAAGEGEGEGEGDGGWRVEKRGRAYWERVTL